MIFAWPSHSCTFDIGLVIQRVSRGGRPQRMRTDFETELSGIRPYQFIDAVRRDAFASVAYRIMTYRPEQGAGQYQIVLFVDYVGPALVSR
jgi:hypothetical protein